jgi:hypothetical protein
MRLKSFGCSFIYGCDLPDENYSTASQISWPALVAKARRLDYTCYAKPGAGNLQILHSILNQIPSSTSDDFFVIGWSWIDRFDYYDPENKNKFNNPWLTIVPNDDSTLAQTYYRELHSELSDKFTCLSYVQLAITMLKQKGIPFVMTYLDELLFDQQWNTTPAIINLQYLIKPHMTTFDGQTFLEWSRSNGYPESTTWHPLDLAHASAADYLINHNLV